MKPNTGCKQEVNDGKWSARSENRTIAGRYSGPPGSLPMAATSGYRTTSGHDGPRGPKAKRGIEGRRVCKVLRAERIPGGQVSAESCFEIDVCGLRADQDWPLIWIESVTGRRSTGRSVKLFKRTERKPTKKGRATRAQKQRKERNTTTTTTKKGNV